MILKVTYLKDSQLAITFLTNDALLWIVEFETSCGFFLNELFKKYHGFQSNKKIMIFQIINDMKITPFHIKITIWFSEKSSLGIFLMSIDL